jgi:hypothetical protein
MTLAVVVAGVVLAAPTAIAAEDAVQEQLRLMEQRMAEMEDRLQATSEELDSAKTTVEEQQEMLSDAGLVDDDRGVRSGVGAFFEAVDVSGVAAASYNYRFIDGGDADGLGNTTGLSDPNSFGGTPNGGASNDSFFTHRNSDTFQIDQVWMTLDKTPTEESRAGFHVDLVWGETAESQSSGSRDTGLLYTGYVSYLAPIGDGVQFDAGKLATTLGAEVLQANQNFNVTNGAVFQTLQPFTHTGVTATTELGVSSWVSSTRSTATRISARIGTRPTSARSSSRVIRSGSTWARSWVRIRRRSAATTRRRIVIARSSTSR